MTVFWRLLCVIVDLYKKKTLGTKILSTNKKRKEKKVGVIIKTEDVLPIQNRICSYKSEYTLLSYFLDNGHVLVVSY